jgi:D-alanyl-D-alanine-carboxypeptidase/D-alanyl-D-alanine-endopeptidase
MGLLSGARGTSLYWVTLSAFVMQIAMVCKAQRLQIDPAVAARSEDGDAIVDQVVQPFFQNSCHVGLSIAIVRRREARFYNFGSTSRTTRTQPGPDSVYEIASVTKTFTGALAAKALLQQRMQLDADFRLHLAGRYPNLERQGHPITLRSLAVHTSGLPRDLPDTDDLYAHRDPETLPYKLIARDSGYDRARYLEELHKVTLKSQPGTKESYSNLGFKLMGWGLEGVYGMPFERALQELILQPLGMNSTGFVLSPDEKARLVDGYSPAGHLMPYHLPNAGAAYGLYSTARDMAKYVEWQLDEANPAIALAHAPIEGDDENGKALVWNLGTLDGDRVLWHGGGTFGMTSQIVLLPREQEGYVFLANDTCNGTESALKDLSTALHARSRSIISPAPVEFPH